MSKNKALLQATITLVHQLSTYHDREAMMGQARSVYIHESQPLAPDPVTDLFEDAVRETTLAQALFHIDEAIRYGDLLTKLEKMLEEADNA